MPTTTGAIDEMMELSYSWWMIIDNDNSQEAKQRLLLVMQSMKCSWCSWHSWYMILNDNSQEEHLKMNDSQEAERRLLLVPTGRWSSLGLLLSSPCLSKHVRSPWSWNLVVTMIMMFAATWLLSWSWCLQLDCYRDPDFYDGNFESRLNCPEDSERRTTPDPTDCSRF